MNTQLRPTAHKRSHSSFRSAIAAPALVKVVFGAVLSVLAVVVWQQFTDLAKQQELVAPWENVQDYAVFYPRSVGNDRQELETGGNASTVAEARDLYPVLAKTGGLYIDAVNYQTSVPKDPSSPWPAPPIRVNDNYLKRYTILDDSQQPIDVKDDEQAWVVAVPEQFKAREAQIKELLQNMRTGGQGITGAVQAEKRITGEPPLERFTRQDVRIIWMASGQSVFSFDPKVNPDHGNMITDPIIEIMTSANSLTVDRLNSITGGLDTGLKVRVNGDPATTLDELAPILKALNLDDNLRHLVSVHEAMSIRVGEARSAITQVTAFAGGALLAMVVLNATIVIIGSDRLRRRLAVRRLHGVSFTQSYRELFLVLGTTWLGQTLLAGAAVVALGMNTISMPADPVSPYTQVLKLLAIAVGSLVVEALLIAVTALILERRNAVKRLKEL